jgi:uncharacterized protein (TIGR02996 family)
LAPTDGAALYRAIVADPGDDVSRLVYADWLEESGDADRAEFIRTQVRLARMNAWDEGYTELRLRADRLAREHGETWATFPGGRRSKHPFGRNDLVRGFVGRVEVLSHHTRAATCRAFSPYPITEATVYLRSGSWTPRQLNWRLTLDALHGLRALTIDADYHPREAALACQVLAGAECRRELTRLEIKGDPTLGGLEAVITSPHLRCLEALSVRGEGVGDEHARLLAANMTLPVLRELILGHNALTPVGAAALGRADWFGRLATVRLYGHQQLGDDGLVRLFSRRLPELRAVEVHHCGASAAIYTLFARRNLPGLIDITLTGTWGWTEQFAALTAGPQQLQSLTLRDVVLRDTAGPTPVFTNHAIRSLRRLWLPSARLDAEGGTALARSSLPRTLRTLDLDCEIQADGCARALLAGPEWPELAHLTIRGWLTGGVLLALIESPKFARLASLKAQCKDGGAVFLKRLAMSPPAARFRELDLSVRMSSASARALADSPNLREIDRLFVIKGTPDRGACERLVERFGVRVEIQGYNAWII